MRMQELNRWHLAKRAKNDDLGPDWRRQGGLIWRDKHQRERQDSRLSRYLAQPPEKRDVLRGKAPRHPGNCRLHWHAQDRQGQKVGRRSQQEQKGTSKVEARQADK